jgi:hypothetical protein
MQPAVCRHLNAVANPKLASLPHPIPTAKSAIAASRNSFPVLTFGESFCAMVPWLAAIGFTLPNLKPAAPLAMLGFAWHAAVF